MHRPLRCLTSSKSYPVTPPLTDNLSKRSRSTAPRQTPSCQFVSCAGASSPTSRKSGIKNIRITLSHPFTSKTRHYSLIWHESMVNCTMARQKWQFLPTLYLSSMQVPTRWGREDWSSNSSARTQNRESKTDRTRATHQAIKPNH